MLPALAEVQRQAMDRFQAFMREQNSEDGGGDAGQGLGIGGHFAGIMLRADLVDRTEPGLSEAGPAAEIAFVAQQDIERLLGGRAAELGVNVRRGVELTGFDADDETVTVRTGHGAIRAGWLVGCDGGRSTVRKLAGFEFPGTEPEITCHQAVVEMTGAEDLKIGWTATDTGVYAYGPMPGRVVTVEFDGPPADRDAPVTTEDPPGTAAPCVELPHSPVTRPEKGRCAYGRVPSMCSSSVRASTVRRWSGLKEARQAS